MANLFETNERLAKTEREAEDENDALAEDGGSDEAKGVGALALYMAPAMVGLLVSQPAASASFFAQSDRALKRDIVPAGTSAGGLDLYSYRYLWSNTTFIGVMAQQAQKVDPGAVTRAADGYLRVDYGRLGLSVQTLEDWAGV